MALSIELPDPSVPSYSPNDLLCGVVKLHTASIFQPCESLCITLQGTIRTSVRQNDDQLVDKQASTHQSSQAFLIRRSVLVARDTELVPTGAHCWPFSFIVPAQVDVNMGFNSANPLGDGFEAEAPWKGVIDGGHHPLPPSMTFRHTKFSGAIEYVLVARLIRPPSVLCKRHNLSTVQIVQIQQTRRQQWTPGYSETQDVNLATSRTSTRSIITNLRMFRRRCLRTERHKPRTANSIQLKMSFPVMVDLHDTSPLRIAVSIEHISSDPTHEPKQMQVTIKMISISLAICTMVRVGTLKDSQITVHNLCEVRNSVLPLKRTLSNNQSHCPKTAYPSAVGSNGSVDNNGSDLERHVGTAIRQSL